jgi:fructose-bisphosphate aldolase class I
MSNINQQLDKIQNKPGFIAALDQSGGSTPKALAAYGIGSDAYSNDDEMFDVVHAMRTRIMTSPAFNGDRIMGAILFENTMDREVEGKGTADYLWEVKKVVPFLKIDKGLMDESNGVQLMKEIPDLDDLLRRARQKNVFGTKMRSVIRTANAKGIKAVVSQQFEIARRIVSAGLVPIIEPEVDINSPQKSAAEKLLKSELIAHLDQFKAGKNLMFKLTLPEQDNFYQPFNQHPKLLKVVALSGGYSRDEANERLARQNGMVASFSRALSEGLSAQQSDDEFNQVLDASIESIFKASCT